jgi:hypothetical protein
MIELADEEIVNMEWRPRQTRNKDRQLSLELNSNRNWYRARHTDAIIH